MPKKRVMIIDDDAIFSDELRDILTSSGYETIVENDPSVATESVRRVDPQVILLDINMPGKNGFDVANELRFGAKDFLTPIIIITGYYKSTFDQAFKMLRIEKCLQKPFSTADLISSIESA